MGTKELIQKLAGIKDALVPVEIELLEVEDDLYPEREERFSSPTPRQVFSRTLAEQEEQLKTNPLLLRFAQSRKKLAADPYRPAYHFVSPESQMNDPNGLCFWQGRGHLFYQAFPADKFPDPKDLRERLL